MQWLYKQNYNKNIQNKNCDLVVIFSDIQQVTSLADLVNKPFKGYLWQDYAALLFFENLPFTIYGKVWKAPASTVTCVV